MHGSVGAVRWFDPVPPRPALEAVLACSWTATPTGRHRLVPDACIDLLWLSTGDMWLCGPETSSWWFEVPHGIVGVGVRFLPGIVPSLLGVDASSIVNRRVRWRELVGSSAESDLVARLADASAARRLELLEDEIERLGIGWSGPDPLAQQVLGRLASEPRLRAGALAAEIGLTPRQLHRRSLVSFAYGVSTLARILRFHRFWCAAEMATGAGGATLTSLAHDAGYADQAHLARDCRAITGSAPSAFLAESFATFPDMSDPYKVRRSGWTTLDP